MNQPFESDVMDDLAAEPPLSSADDSYNKYDGFEDFDDEDESFADGVTDYGDSSDGLNDFNHHFDAAIHQELSTGSGEGLEALETAIAEALSSTNGHTFLRRLNQILQQTVPQRPGQRDRYSQLRNGKRSSRSKSFGQPSSQQTASIARVANLAAQLVREDADAVDALEAFFELAETDPTNASVVPVIAGLSLHQTIPNAAGWSQSHRQRLMQSGSLAAQTLTQKQGAQALAALPRILEVVERNATAQRLAQKELPEAIQRITRRVAADTDLVHRLIHPTHLTQTPLKVRSPQMRSPQKSSNPFQGTVQRLVFDRPVEISIRHL